MTNRNLNRVAAALLVAGLAGIPACAPAAMAGAGAAAGIHMTGNSASATIPRPLAEVDARTQAVLAELGVQVDERKDEGSGFEYKGSARGMEIRVELDSTETGGTEVKASARRSPVQWDNDFAREIVGRISSR